MFHNIFLVIPDSPDPESLLSLPGNEYPYQSQRVEINTFGFKGTEFPNADQLENMDELLKVAEPCMIN